jgi:hypothetical protein
MGEHIPQFDSLEEEAAYWDKTDLTTLSPDEVEEVQVDRPERPLSATFAIRLDRETLEAVRAMARSKGLGPTQLVRSWILERVRASQNVELPNLNENERAAGLFVIGIMLAKMGSFYNEMKALMDANPELSFEEAASQIKGRLEESLRDLKDLPSSEPDFWSFVPEHAGDVIMDADEADEEWLGRLRHKPKSKGLVDP